jgi:multidrug efflux system membrane fusion protein
VGLEAETAAQDLADASAHPPDAPAGVASPGRRQREGEVNVRGNAMTQERTSQEGARPAGTVAVAMAGVALAAVALVSCSKADPPSFQRPPAPVTVADAVVRDVPVYLDELGKCVAREVVTVEPQVSGRITQLRFADGAEVRPGDPLFTIDPRPFQAQLDAAQATLAQARAALALARSEYARAGELIKTKAISQEEYDTRKNAVEVAGAQVQQGEAAVETARLNLDYTSIRSPIEGRTGHRLVDIGNVVTANVTPLLTIQRLDPIYVDFTVTQSDLTEVQRNMARGALTAEVRLPGDGEPPAAGRLTFLDNAVQDATGTVALRATIPNPDHRFWPGRLVNVRLILRTLPSAVLVPAAAPQVSGKGPFVFVVTKDSTAELRPVSVGEREGDLVVISHGVAPGERVVVSGQLAVTPGGKVRFTPPSPGPAVQGGGSAGGAS